MFVSVQWHLCLSAATKMKKTKLASMVKYEAESDAGRLFCDGIPAAA